MKKVTVLALFLLACSLLYNCATVPMTGRKQASLKSAKNLEKMAESEYRRFLSQHRLSQNTEQVRRVREVSFRLIDAAGRYYAQNKMEKQFKRFKWEVNVVEDPDPNAFCMPGGKIAVLTGILAVTENDDQLAAIIGHEIGHALAQHSREKMSHGLLAELGHVGVQVATRNASGNAQQTAEVGYTVGATFGFMLPYGRKLEKEADQIGLRLMTMAGYDPQEASRFWDRMIQKFGDKKTAFFSTHPTSKSRKKELAEQVPEAIAFAAPYLDKTEPKKVIAGAALPATTPPVAVNGAAPVGTLPASESFQPVKRPAGQNAKSAKYIVVQVEVVSNYAAVQRKYETLTSLGDISVEAATVEGAPCERVLLGQFGSVGEARAALGKVQRKGFPGACMVEYTDGVRGKWVN